MPEVPNREGSDLEANNSVNQKNIVNEGDSKESYLNDLISDNMGMYISKNIQNGRIKVVKIKDRKDQRNYYKRDYFSDEAWDIFSFSVQKLLKEEPTGEAIKKCVEYTSELLGDGEEGREVATILTTTIFSDCTKLSGDKRTTAIPQTVYENDLQEKIKHKKDLMSEILNLTSSYSREELEEKRIVDLDILLSHLKLDR